MIRLMSPRADRLGEEIRELLRDLLAVEGASAMPAATYVFANLTKLARHILSRSAKPALLRRWGAGCLRDPC